MSPDAMTSGWYYAKAGAPVGHEIGPLSWQELYLLAQDRTLTPADLVWNPKLPRGVTAGQVPGLFPSHMLPETTPLEVAPPVETPPVAADSTGTATATAPQTATTPAPALSTPGVHAQPSEPTTQALPADLVAQTPPAETVTSAPLPDTDTQAPSPAGTLATATEEDTAMVQGSAPTAESPPAGSEPESAEDKPTASPKKREHSNLPLLIVLLALAIAAAGLATYFVYLRDLWT